MRWNGGISEALTAAVGILEDLRKPHREFDALAQLSCASGIGWSRPAQLLDPIQQDFKALLEHFLAECRIGTRAREVGIGDRRKGVHSGALAKDSLGD
jgi:hypothetical protein